MISGPHHVRQRPPGAVPLPGPGLCHSVAHMRRTSSTVRGPNARAQHTRRAHVQAVEADVYTQVMERDGHACVLCGTRQRPTLQHILPRAAGGTSIPIDARLGIIACGSGTTFCHGAIEHAGRYEGWAYQLGYLARHGRALEQVRLDPDATWLVWGHDARVWWELTRAGTRLAVPQEAAPDVDTLRLVDAAIGRPVTRSG